MLVMHFGEGFSKPARISSWISDDYFSRFYSRVENDSSSRLKNRLDSWAQLFETWITLSTWINLYSEDNTVSWFPSYLFAGPWINAIQRLSEAVWQLIFYCTVRHTEQTICCLLLEGDFHSFHDWFSDFRLLKEGDSEFEALKKTFTFC